MFDALLFSFSGPTKKFFFDYSEEFFEEALKVLETAQANRKEIFLEFDDSFVVLSVERPRKAFSLFKETVRTCPFFHRKSQALLSSGERLSFPETQILISPPRTEVRLHAVDSSDEEAFFKMALKKRRTSISVLVSREGEVTKAVSLSELKRISSLFPVFGTEKEKGSGLSFIESLAPLEPLELREASFVKVESLNLTPISSFIKEAFDRRGLLLNFSQKVGFRQILNRWTYSSREEFVVDLSDQRSSSLFNLDSLESLYWRVFLRDFEETLFLQKDGSVDEAFQQLKICLRSELQNGTFSFFLKKRPFEEYEKVISVSEDAVETERAFLIRESAALSLLDLETEAFLERPLSSLRQRPLQKRSKSL